MVESSSGIKYIDDDSHRRQKRRMTIGRTFRVESLLNKLNIKYTLEWEGLDNTALIYAVKSSQDDNVELDEKFKSDARRQDVG